MDVIGLYSKVLGRVLRNSFPIWQKMGFHVVPNHFYQPIPDTSALSEDLWKKPTELVGVDLGVDAQLELLETFARFFKGEYDAFPREKTRVSSQFFLSNESYPAVDAEILYSMIRHFKPKRIFEIGSGNSTLLAAQAALANGKEGCSCELLAFEPYPNETLRAGFPGLSGLKAVQVQEVPLSQFETLEANDILFIDSSHVLKIGSDVQYEFLEVLPRLRAGVMVHLHDIFLPAEYPKEWVFRERRFWNEQYLLQAFLSFNSHFQTIWAGHFMHLRHPEALGKAIAAYDRKTAFPGSYWIRKST